MQRFALLALVATCGCSSSLSPRPTPADTLASAFAPDSVRSASEHSLRRFLGPSRAIRMSDEKLSSDGVYDYASYYVQYALDSGWEGTYHTRLVFVKKCAERDWAVSRIFTDPSPYTHAPAFLGPIEVLEKRGDEFGRQAPNKSPEPTP
jgi:hypothetical protein